MTDTTIIPHGALVPTPDTHTLCDAELGGEGDGLRAALNECALQLAYLHDIFPKTGTTEAVLFRARAALAAHPANKPEPAQEAVRSALKPALPGMRYKHVKRGSEYTVRILGMTQCAEPLEDNDTVVIYTDDKDGSAWVRPLAEFYDGRFEKIADTHPPAPSADALDAARYRWLKSETGGALVFETEDFGEEFLVMSRLLTSPKPARLTIDAAIDAEIAAAGTATERG